MHTFTQLHDLIRVKKSARSTPYARDNAASVSVVKRPAESFDTRPRMNEASTPSRVAIKSKTSRPLLQPALSTPAHDLTLSLWLFSQEPWRLRTTHQTSKPTIDFVVDSFENHVVSKKRPSNHPRLKQNADNKGGVLVDSRSLALQHAGGG